MKTIEEAAIEYSKKQYGYDPIMRFQCETHFEAGIEFAQSWILMKDEKPEYYTPVIVDTKDGEIIAWRAWSETYGDIYTINGTSIVLKEIPTKWRPTTYFK